jgi:hypothetical protein
MIRKLKTREKTVRENVFITLMLHFWRRILASDEEQSADGSVGFGLGAVLALLAAPGGFASLILLNKYSTLLQWFRGQIGFNPLRASVADEYFFVVLSMTITGLVMVIKWNRLLPDTRDFANLAVLPIPIRNIFLSNLAALIGVGLLIGIVVNAVSCLLFPFFVTMALDSFPLLFRFAIANAVTVFLASAFSFFAVFAAVGLLMLLPSSVFRPVSLLVRIMLLIALLAGLASNLLLQLFAGQVSGHSYVRLLPSFWFLGIYEDVAGMAGPGMVSLGHRAVAAVLIALVLGLLAYAACYRRHFLRLSESMDRIGGSRRSLRFPFVSSFGNWLFRNRLERACCPFALKVLLRSERHVMFVGAYLGLGLVLIASLPSAGLLTLSLLAAFLTTTGLRFAFEMPAALEANWIFRATLDFPGETPRRVAGKILLLSTLSWQIGLLFPFLTWRYGWVTALDHTVLIAALTVLFIEGLLIGFRKIPFTCSSQADVRRYVIRVLVCVFAVAFAVPLIAGLGSWTLNNLARVPVFAVLYAGAWYLLRYFRREAEANGERLIFEERLSTALNVLGEISPL